MVKGIPRQAVLKPAHAIYKLQNQKFALGDRVTMVQDSGGVPLCAKGVVIGLNNSSVDVVWDVPFLSGTDLRGRYVLIPDIWDYVQTDNDLADARNTAGQHVLLILVLISQTLSLSCRSVTRRQPPLLQSRLNHGLVHIP